MIGELIYTIKKTYNFKRKISIKLLFFFVIISISAVNGQAQLKGGKVANTTVLKPVKGTTYAIIFGVSNYPGLTPLKYADKDAALFRDFLETPAGGNTKPENIFFRINEHAKDADFNIDAYTWLMKRKLPTLKEGDRVYIYFSGHGDAMNEDNYFLLPYDCTPNNEVNNYLATGRIEMYHLKTLFIKPLIKQKVEVLLIVDACRTNDLPGGQQGQENFVQSIAEQKEGEIIMLSTGAGQSAVEGPKIGDGHGLFTWYLVAGLSGEADYVGDAADHDGKVSLAELTSYVKNKVRKEAKDVYGTDQVPVFISPDKDLETLAVVDSGTYANWKLAENIRQQTNGNGNIVAVVNKNVDKKAVTPNSVTDTALIAVDNKFIAAIKTGILSGKNSAEEYYDKMEKNWPGQSITNDAKYTLATEFINFGQEKINLYLSGKGIIHIQYLENSYKVNNKRNSAVNKDSAKNTPNSVEEQITRMKEVASTGFDKAAEMMDKAVNLLKNDPELLTALYPKLYFLKAGSLQYSNNTFKKKQAIAFVKKAISEDVSAAYNYELLGDLLNDFGNDSCKTYYEKAIELAPKWAYPENGIGNYYNDKKNYQLALIHYNKAIRLDSLDEIIYQNIGSMYHNEAKGDSAKKYYLKALSIDSCDFYACANLGSLYKDSIKSTNKSYYFNLSSHYLKRAIKCNPGYAWAYGKLAQLFDQVDKGDSSIYYCKAGINKNPDNATLYRNLAGEYFYQKDTSDAEKFYVKALTVDSLDINNYITLGWFYRRMGLSTKAISDPDPKKYFSKAILNYQSAIQLDPGDKFAYNDLGLVYNNLKMYDKAVMDYQLAIRIDSGFALAYNNLANVYYDKKVYDKAIPIYQKAIQADSSFASPYYNLALIYDNLKAYDKAAMYYSKSISHDSTQSTAYTYLGDIYYNQKIYDKAIVNYQKAIGLDRDYPLLYVYLGDAYHKLKMDDQAILYYQKAIYLDSAYASAYYNLGISFYNLKAYDKAILNYQKAIHLDTGNTSAYNDLGNVYYDQKIYDQAILNYQKAIHLDSAYSDPYFNLGLIYTNQKAYDKAILNYQKVIYLDSANTSACYNLGLIYDALKTYDKALIYYKKAYSIDPSNIDYITNLGYSYTYNKDFKSGIALFEKALSIKTEDPWSYYNLACAWTLSGDTDKGMAYLKNALEKGFKDHDHILQDDDIANLKKTSEFNSLMKQYFPDKLTSN